MRRIPITMATQHPDNAAAPHWKPSEAFIAAREELAECMYCFSELGTQEYLWDWEGKYADEAVIDRLFSEHLDYFKKHHLGKDKFLTFRIPNVWQEKGYSLIRALMVILTSEDFAKDLNFHPTPLFEVILPMTERADQLMYIQSAFSKLAHLKNKVFNHRTDKNNDYLELIPLVEGVHHQIGIRKLLEEYIALHKKQFGKKPVYMRPFIARSDPALSSGNITIALANKIALSDIALLSKEQNIPMHPIIGVGCLPFRGGMTPGTINEFIKQHGGVRTVMIQSGFRYDYPENEVKQALRTLERELPKTQTQPVTTKDRTILVKLIKRAEIYYQKTLKGLLKEMQPIFKNIPKRRERRQHLGFLAYQRKSGESILPRAINFTAAFYSVGIPPELIGLGKFLHSLSAKERQVVENYYSTLVPDTLRAGWYLNKDNLNILAKKSAGWRALKKDISITEKELGIILGPVDKDHWLHKNLSSNALLLKDKPKELKELVTETGKLRQSMG